LALNLVDSWAWVVGLALLKTDSVYHDPALNVATDYFALVIEGEGFPMIVAMVDAHQGNKFATALN